MQEPVSIVDYVSEGRQRAVEALMDAMRTGNLRDVGNFPLTVSVVSSLVPDLVTAVAMPIFLRFFSDYALDMYDGTDLNTAAKFDGVIATNIRDAANVVMDHLRQRNEKTETAKGKLLRGTLAR
jgi:hypothetical protein